MDVATGADVDGPIDRARYSPVAWLPGGTGFYYVRRLDPPALPEDERQYHRRVYRHALGTDPADDQEIFGAGMDIRSYYGVSVSRDGRWLTVSAATGTAPRNDVWIADLAAAAAPCPEGDHARCRARRPDLGARAEAGRRRPGRPGRHARRPRRPALRGHRPRRPARAAGRHRPRRTPEPQHLAGPARRTTPRRSWRTSPSSTAPELATTRCCWRHGPGTRCPRSPPTTCTPAPGWTATAAAFGCRASARSARW